MKCQSCGKREATIRYMEDINGKKQEMHFCVECAKKLGFVDFSNIFSPMFSSIPDFFDEFDVQEQIKCPTCGTTFEDYGNTGMLGCPECYNTFKSSLDDIFLKLHGKNRHIKISPVKNRKVLKESKLENVETLDELKEELRELVQNEEYEKAAVIRDKIKKIEKKSGEK